MDFSPVAAAAATKIGTTWSQFHVFTDKDSKVSLPTSIDPLNAETCKSFSKLFTSAEYAVRAGIALSGASYAVHQYETTRGVDLVYGRTGDAVSGSGACVARVQQANGDCIYAAVSYDFPSLSANAVPELVELAHLHLNATNATVSASADIGSA